MRFYRADQRSTGRRNSHLLRARRLAGGTQRGENRDLTVFDATCPLVTKVHMEVARASRRGEESILIGHAGHPEVEGTMGQYSNPEGACIWLSHRKTSLR